MALRFLLLCSLLMLVLHHSTSSTSTTPQPSSGMTVRLALIEDELGDLKKVIKDLTQLTKESDTKLTQLGTKQKGQFVWMQKLNDQLQKLNDKTTALKTKQDINDEAIDDLKKAVKPPKPSDLRNMIQSEIEKMENVSSKQEQFETTQQELTAKQTVIENMVQNHSIIISTQETTIANLKAEQKDNRDGIDKVKSELKNATDVFKHGVEKVSQRQVVLDNHLNLQSHVINTLIVSTENIGKGLAMEAATRQNTSTEFKTELSKITSGQGQLEGTMKSHYSEFRDYKNSTNIRFQSVVNKQELVSKSMFTQNTTIGANCNATANNKKSIQKAETAIQGQGKILKTINEKVASLEAKAKVQTTEIKNLGLQQTVLEQKQKDARTLPKVQQIVWRSTSGYSTYNGQIKYLNYHKKLATSSIRVRFTSNAHHYYHNGYCHRWYFRFNGQECNNPEKIEAVLYKRGSSSYGYIMPIEVTGICYGITSGNVKVELMIGQCASGNSYSGTIYTGWYTSSRITVEEVNIVSH